MTPTAEDPLETQQDNPTEALPPDQDDPTAVYRQIYGERYERLPNQLINEIRETTKKLAAQDRFMRRIEVIRDRRWRFYEKGIQHVFETNGGGFIQATPGALLPTSQGSIQCGEFVDDYDIFGPYARIIQSVLTQNSPGIAFQPNSSDRAEDKAAAEAAEGYWEMFQKSNDIKDLQCAIVRMFELSGRCCSWTRTQADAQKFGFNPDGTPKKMEVTTIYGTLEHKTSILAKDLSGALFNILYEDPNVLEAKADHPEAGWDGKTFASKISANQKGLGEDEYERQARIGVLQGTRILTQVGESIGHLATTANVWLRPAAFADAKQDMFTEPGEGDTGGCTIGEKIKQLFPEGVHAVFVGDIYCGSWNEATEDALEVEFPYKGDGMFRRAIMDPLGVVQDAVNDDLNAFREVANYGWPSTWINADQEQFKAITKEVSAPYAFRQFELRQDAKLSDNVYREPDPVVPPTLFELMNFLQGPFAQFLLACPPSLWGEAMQDQKTASGYHLAASQAMGQMGLWFGRIQRMFSRIAYQAALCAAKNPDHAQQIAIPGDGGTTQIQLSAITKERFRAYPDEDSSFPESTMQKRATLDGILEFATQAPEVGMALLSDPNNWRTILTLKGFPELKIPQAEAAAAAQFKIEQLLQQSPMRSPMAIQAAATQGIDPMQLPPDQPSMQPGPLDYHQWEFEYFQRWLNSQACRDQQAQGNTQGAQNVLMYALALQQMTAPPPMLPPTAPGGAPAPSGPAAGPSKPEPAPEAPIAAPTL